jgi:hypothetical protein
MPPLRQAASFRPSAKPRSCLSIRESSVCLPVSADMFPEGTAGLHRGGISYLLQAEPGSQQCAKREECAHQVRCRVGKPREKVDISKETRIATGGIGKNTAQNRSNHDTDIEGHWECEKGSALVSVLSSVNRLPAMKYGSPLTSFPEQFR